jgi:hypothetical protein
MCTKVHTHVSCNPMGQEQPWNSQACLWSLALQLLSNVGADDSESALSFAGDKS